MIVYTIVSPFVGWLGDRYDRRSMLSFGVGLWSVATVGTAFSQNYEQMFLWRSLLGVGEATYGVIAPALLADLFPPKQRGRVMGLYYLALPLGGALGYGIGGWVADAWHWRIAFWVVGLPGPVRGHDRPDDPRPRPRGLRGQGGSRARPIALKLRDYLAAVPHPVVPVQHGGHGAAGHLRQRRLRGVGLPTRSTRRSAGCRPRDAGIWIGGMTALAGLLGIALGMWLPDFLLRFTSPLPLPADGQRGDPRRHPVRDARDPRPRAPLTRRSASCSVGDGSCSPRCSGPATPSPPTSCPPLNARSDTP